MNKDNRDKAIDGLRGLSFIPIVMCHLGDDNTFNGILGYIHKYGASFVTMFFMLSGFCICRKYRESISTIKLEDFLVKRLKKIYPMCFISITVGVILSIVDGFWSNYIITMKPYDPIQVILSYLLIQVGWVRNDGCMPYGSGIWFICVLVLCYIIYWFINILIKNKSFRKYAYIILVLIGWSCKINGYNLPFFTSWNGKGYLGFFLGVLICEILNEIKIKEGGFYAVFSLEILVFLIGVIMSNEGNIDEYLTLIIFPTLLIGTQVSNFANRLLAIFSPLGQISMEVYLSHVHVINIFRMLGYKGIVNSDFTTREAFVWVWIWIIVVALIWHFAVKGFKVVTNGKSSI
jgi:peptidoglycan/LPS O-acetylase OafA/YrhL